MDVFNWFNNSNEEEFQPDNKLLEEVYGRTEENGVPLGEDALKYGIVENLEQWNSLTYEQHVNIRKNFYPNDIDKLEHDLENAYAYEAELDYDYSAYDKRKAEAQNQIIELQEQIRFAKMDTEMQQNPSTKEEPEGLNNLQKTENLKTAEADNQEKSKTTEIETPVNQNGPSKQTNLEPSNGHYLTSPVVQREASQKELREVNSEWGLLHAKMQNDTPLTKEEFAELEPRLKEHQKELEEQRAFVSKERPFTINDPKPDKEDIKDHQEPSHAIDQSSGSYEKPVTKDHIDALREQIEQSKDKLWDDEIEYRELDYHYTEQHPDHSHWELLNNHSDLSDAYYSYKDEEIQSQEWGYEADYYQDKLEAYSEDFREDWNEAKGMDIPPPEGMEPDV